MAGAVIETEGLRKEYRRWRGGPIVAVDDISLSVPEGGVFGFLGPNGSGKTTTIRVLLGLAGATSGAARLLGGAVPGDLADRLPRVGALVESPALFGGFSARRNLAIQATIAGISSARVDEVLDRVGLADRADDRVKEYSLGMKQRAAIAGALMTDPELLILDEPANGLDPAGIREIRDLIISLGAEGRTVFVSSHQLAEVQQMCDRVAILNRGRCIHTGPVRDLTANIGGAAAILVTVPDPAAARSVLENAGFAATDATTRGQLRVHCPHDRAADVNRILAGAGQWASELRPDETTLEDAFLRLVSEPADSDADADAETAGPAGVAAP
ncbi:MAG TPA: ABC transporter ATP-binding protein [Acidimicrobiales bacterium]